MSTYAVSTRGLAAHKLPQGALATIMEMLYANSEKGIAKLDFSDFTGMYQDRARTIPYTAVEQPLGSFTGLNGVTATAPADVNRGKVSARVNLLTKTEQFSDAAWFKNGVSVTPAAGIAPNGELTAQSIQITTTGTFRYVRVTSPVNAGYPPVSRIFAKYDGHRYIAILGTGGGNLGALFDLLTGSVSNIKAGAIASITPVSTGWYLLSYYDPGSAEFNIGAHWYLTDGAMSTGTVSAGKVLLWGGSLTLATDAHLPYQRVNTPTDYDTAGFPHYLAFNGTNTAYATPSIDFTGTDKMTVWAGVENKTSGTQAVLLELTAFGLNPGAFSLYRLGANTFAFASIGPSPNNAITALVPAGILSVITGTGDVSTGNVVIRHNGASTSASNAGSGTYANAPLYIGSRAGSSNFLTGKAFSIIVRGAATPLPQIEAVENLIRQKMRLP